MTLERQRKLALGLGGVSAFLILVGVALMLADHIAAARRAPAEKSRIDELTEQVKTDAGIAERLHEERDRQRDVSLARKARNRAIAWVLLVAGGVLVASGKWYLSKRSPRLPVLEEVLSARFPPTPPAKPRRVEAQSEAPPTVEQGIDLSFVDDLVARVGRDREAAMPILQAIQAHYRYLPDDALQRVCDLTEISPAQIAGTSSFYARFRRSPVGRHVVRVCHGTACHVAGAEQITQELRRHLEIAPEEDTDPRRLFTLDRVACLGCCSLAPVMMIEQDTAGRLTPASARLALDALAPRT